MQNQTKQGKMNRGHKISHYPAISPLIHTHSININSIKPTFYQNIQNIQLIQHLSRKQLTIYNLQV